VAREDDERTTRKAHIRSMHILPYAYLQTRALSRLAILESEKDDYLHRDTSSLNRLVYLLIYLSVALCVPYSSIDVSLGSPLFLLLFSFFLIRDNVFARTLRKTVNMGRVQISNACDRNRDYDVDADNVAVKKIIKL